MEYNLPRIPEIDDPFFPPYPFSRSWQIKVSLEIGGITYKALFDPEASAEDIAKALKTTVEYARRQQTVPSGE